MMSEHFPLKEETYRILGACFEVYNELGRLITRTPDKPGDHWLQEW